MDLAKEEQKEKLSNKHMQELNKIPFLGICFGMQMAIIEFARNKLNIKKCYIK